MGQHRELNQITTPKNAKHLRIPVMFLTYQVTRTNALVDSGASGNYMLTQFHATLNRHIKRIKKGHPYKLTMVNGQTAIVQYETDWLEMFTGHHYEKISFDIIELATQDIYLRMPWLRKHNPVVNWKTGVLSYNNCISNHAIPT